MHSCPGVQVSASMATKASINRRSARTTHTNKMSMMAGTQDDRTGCRIAPAGTAGYELRRVIDNSLPRNWRERAKESKNLQDAHPIYYTVLALRKGAPLTSYAVLCSTKDDIERTGPSCGF